MKKAMASQVSPRTHQTLWLYVILTPTLFHLCANVRVSSSCGHPGVPPDGTIYQTDPDRIRFDDGQVVRYRCPQEFHIFKQTRKCVSGRWTGPKGRCAVAIDNDIKSVQVFDCSDNSTKATTKEILNMRLNQSENPLRLTNSFHPSRLSSAPLKANGSTCYLWKFQLTRPAMISLMTIDMGTQVNELTDGQLNASLVSVSKSDLFSAESFVSPHRICRAIHSDHFLNPDSDTNTTFLLKGFYFSCDSISEKEYSSEVTKMSQTVIVRTESTVVRDIHLVAVFLAQHKLNPKDNRPQCGKPETVNTGVNHRTIYKSGISQFQVQCNDSFTDITRNKPNATKPDYWYSLNCSINGQWEGVFPLCVPTIQCPGLEYLEQNKDQSVVIESIENVYYVNASHWVAGEHSQVNFACADPEHIVVGKLVILCMKNGLWSHLMPKCTAYVRPESLSSVAHSPWIVIAILTLLLSMFLSLVLLIVRKYIQNMRKELMRYQNKSRNQSSLYTDAKSNSINYIYDDCDNNRVNWKADRMTKKGWERWERCKLDAEYIELEATRNSRYRTSAEPLYIPILPPTQ